VAFEQPLIRPPSEWRSGLIRVTRGCGWNRCRFCGIYPHLGEPAFSIRPLREVLADVTFLHHHRPETETLFLGDADPLQAGVATIAELSRHLHQMFPLRRLTAYARASTLKKIGRDGVLQLAAAGLNRIHLGLESGSDEILRYQRKGQSARILGLGGATLWRQHALATADLLNDIAPAFIRIRRLWIYPGSANSPGSPLLPEIESGNFTPQTAEGTVLELQLLLRHLTVEGPFLTCDHANNYISVRGTLPQDRPSMLETIDAFLSQPAAVRERHYQEISSSM